MKCAATFLRSKHCFWRGKKSEDWWSLADIHLPHLAGVQKHKYHGNCWLNDPHVDFEHTACAVRGWYSASRIVNRLRSYILGGKMDHNQNIQHWKNTEQKILQTMCINNRLIKSCLVRYFLWQNNEVLHFIKLTQNDATLLLLLLSKHKDWFSLFKITYTRKQAAARKLEKTLYRYLQVELRRRRRVFTSRCRMVAG